MREKQLLKQRKTRKNHLQEILEAGTAVSCISFVEIENFEIIYEQQVIKFDIFLKSLG